MSELVESRFRDGTEIPFETLSNMARFLFGAGQDTTSHLISMSIKQLAERPELQQRLRADPSRIPDFIEEVLRFDPPVKVAYRLAMHDTQLAGVDIAAGSVMTACLVGLKTLRISISTVRDCAITCLSAGVCTPARARRWPGWNVASRLRGFSPGPAKSAFRKSTTAPPARAASTTCRPTHSAA
jgi:hypothetical protein